MTSEITVHQLPTYRLDDQYVWGPVLIKADDGVWHLFHLQAPRTAGPVQRHKIPNIGQATSTDLIHWDYRGTAFDRGPKGRWDDRRVITGGIVRFNGKYYMLYAGNGHDEKYYWPPRMGLAVSEDLYHWERVQDDPVLEPDDRYYRHDGAWADSSLLWVDGFFYAVFKARAADLPRDAAGCIGMAQSSDLIHWDILPPVFCPENWHEIEMPQLLHHNGLYYLFYGVIAGCANDRYRSEIAPAQPITGLRYVVSENICGPYRQIDDGILFSTESHLYAINVAPIENDRYLAFAETFFEPSDENADHYGTIAGPLLIAFDKTANIAIYADPERK